MYMKECLCCIQRAYFASSFLFIRYEERELKYYDTSLVLKGKITLGKDLKVRLVDAKEVEGRPNAFEVSSGEEK